MIDKSPTLALKRLRRPLARRTAADEGGSLDGTLTENALVAFSRPNSNPLDETVPSYRQGVGARASLDACGDKCQAWPIPDPGSAGQEFATLPSPVHGFVPWGERGVWPQTLPSTTGQTEERKEG